MKPRRLPLLFALIKLFSGYLLLSPAYGLQRDEYLYLDRALPPAQSTNGSYLLWWPAPRAYRAVIVIDDAPHPEIAPHFASYRRVGEITNPYARERGTAIFVGLGPDGSIQAQVRREWRAALAAWEGP